MSREMDALVAKKVMGYALMIHINYPEREPVLSPAMFSPDYTDEDIKVPHYSTDIAAAWQVVEKITDIPKTVKEAKRATNTKFAYWFDNANLWAMSASEAAEAICRAALKAVEND